jgi:type II secretory pathway pseudopilin PulG
MVSVEREFIRPAAEPSPGRERGFTYLGLLFAIAILGLALSTVGVVWSTQIRRDREVELLFVGDQIREAIGRYYAAGGVYPLQLSDLVQDQRVPEVRRFLRRVYPDPMTGNADWQLILGTGNGIIGVASSSQLKPIKVAQFPDADSDFEKKECYCDWKFVYAPRYRQRRSVTSAVPQS